MGFRKKKIDEWSQYQSDSTKNRSETQVWANPNVLLHGFTRTFCQCRSDSICQFWSRGICQRHSQLCSLCKHCTQSQRRRPFVYQLSLVVCTFLLRFEIIEKKVLTFKPIEILIKRCIYTIFSFQRIFYNYSLEYYHYNSLFYPQYIILNCLIFYAIYWILLFFFQHKF